VVLGRCGLGELPLGHDVVRSAAATKLSSRRRLSFFFFLKREDVRGGPRLASPCLEGC
jgi:hypothetical protein